MNEFKDRNVQYPNRKRLIVNDIVYENDGNISELVVDVVRQEGETYEEGTELNASKLNAIIRNLSYSCIEEFIETNREDFKALYENLCEEKYYYLKDLEVVNRDKESLIIPTSVSTGLILPVTTESGCMITWRSNNSEVIEINNNSAVVHQDIVYSSAILIATIKYNRASAIKEFVVSVSSREATNDEIVCYDAAHINMPEEVYTNFDLQTQGTIGSIINWYSDNNCIKVKADMGVVTRGVIDQYDYLSGVVKYKDASITRSFEVKVRGLIGFLRQSLYYTWTQSLGSLNTKDFILNVHPENEENDYSIEVETENNYLTVVSQREAIDKLKFTISETNTLNAVPLTENLKINYTLKFYKLVGESKTLVGKEEGILTYTM